MGKMLSFLLVIFFVVIGDTMFYGTEYDIYEPWTEPSGFFYEDRRIPYVDIHNQIRLMLTYGMVPNQPRAANLRPLKYDPRLAWEAQKLANQCRFRHNDVKDGRWQWVGQNLFMSMSPDCREGTTWQTAIKSWFDENRMYRYPENPTKDTAHYTQLASARTEYVGCAVAICRENFSCNKLFVCNYGPGGNNLGEAPYTFSYFH